MKKKGRIRKHSKESTLRSTLWRRRRWRGCPSEGAWNFDYDRNYNPNGLTAIRWTQNWLYKSLKDTTAMRAIGNLYSNHPPTHHVLHPSRSTPLSPCCSLSTKMRMTDCNIPRIERRSLAVLMWNCMSFNIAKGRMGGEWLRICKKWPEVLKGWNMMSFSVFYIIYAGNVSLHHPENGRRLMSTDWWSTVEKVLYTRMNLRPKRSIFTHFLKEKCCK